MKPELLSPAGTLKNMRYAFAYGADAVYSGQPRYSLRVRNNEFNLEKLEAVTEATFFDSFINEDVSDELSELLLRKEELNIQSVQILAIMNNVLSTSYKNTFSLKDSTDGLFLEISQKKFVAMESDILDLLKENGYEYSLKKLKGVVKITIKDLTDISNNKRLIDDKIKTINFEIFYNALLSINSKHHYYLLELAKATPAVINIPPVTRLKTFTNV